MRVSETHPRADKESVAGKVGQREQRIGHSDRMPILLAHPAGELGAEENVVPDRSAYTDVCRTARISFGLAFSKRDVGYADARVETDKEIVMFLRMTSRQ
jgi:hypothetical protein